MGRVSGRAGLSSFLLPTLLAKRKPAAPRPARAGLSPASARWPGRMSSGQVTGAGPATPGRMTEAEFRSLYDQLRAEPPWGPADRRGALNYLSPATMLAAVGDVKLGRSVSLAGPIEYRVTADNPEPARHKMTATGDSAADGGLSFAMDQIGMNVHGNADTHIDALSHVVYDGRLYN